MPVPCHVHASHVFSAACVCFRVFPYADGGVVWLVSWPGVGRREHKVGCFANSSQLNFAPLADTSPVLKLRLPHEHWHYQGAEGRLVKLPKEGLWAQPAAGQGPLRPGSRDIGIVLRDMGPGVYCGLLVRKLGGAAALW